MNLVQKWQVIAWIGVSLLVQKTEAQIGDDEIQKREVIAAIFVPIAAALICCAPFILWIYFKTRKTSDPVILKDFRQPNGYYTHHKQPYFSDNKFVTLNSNSPSIVSYRNPSVIRVDDSPRLESPPVASINPVYEPDDNERVDPNEFDSNTSVSESEIDVDIRSTPASSIKSIPSNGSPVLIHVDNLNDNETFNNETPRSDPSIADSSFVYPNSMPANGYSNRAPTSFHSPRIVSYRNPSVIRVDYSPRLESPPVASINPVYEPDDNERVDPNEFDSNTSVSESEIDVDIRSTPASSIKSIPSNGSPVLIYVDNLNDNKTFNNETPRSDPSIADSSSESNPSPRTVTPDRESNPAFIVPDAADERYSGTAYVLPGTSDDDNSVLFVKTKF